MRKKLALLIATLMTTACGGGDDNGGSSNADRLFADYAETVGSGSQYISAHPDNINHPAAAGCTYSDSAPFSRDWVNEHIKQNGGSIIVDRSDKFCATSQAVDMCLIRIGDRAYSYHISSDYSLNRDEVRLAIDMGAGQHVSIFARRAMNGSQLQSRENSIATHRRDSSATASYCPTATPGHRNASDINGAWTGYRLTYDRVNRVGNLENDHKMTCLNGVCAIETGGISGLQFKSVTQPGVWMHAAGMVEAGAVMGTTRQTVGVWYCQGNPPNRILIDSSCQLYAFKRN